MGRAREILGESARYNLGTTERNFNVPTLALAFLLPANQARFSFREAGNTRPAAPTRIEYQERDSPTIIQHPRLGDLRSRGQFWVDPGDGTVRRSKLELDVPQTDSRVAIVVSYVAVSGFSILLPDKMDESYENEPDMSRGLVGEYVHCIAAYSKYRRFEVETQEMIH